MNTQATATLLDEEDRCLLAAAKELPEGPYKTGFLSGLRRVFYGAANVDDETHECFFYAARLDDERQRGISIERGYRDALNRSMPDAHIRRGTLSIGGRPPILGVGSRTVSARVSAEHYDRYTRLGGVQWLREQLDKSVS